MIYTIIIIICIAVVLVIVLKKLPNIKNISLPKLDDFKKQSMKVEKKISLKDEIESDNKNNKKEKNFKNHDKDDFFLAPLTHKIGDFFAKPIKKMQKPKEVSMIPSFMMKKPFHEGALFDEADMFFKHGSFDEAEKLYIKIVAANPKNIKVYNRLGVIYMEKKNFVDAKEAFLMAVKLDSKKASRHYNLATAYDELREYRNAKESLKKALSMDKSNKKYKKYLKDLQEKIDYRYKEMKRKED